MTSVTLELNLQIEAYKIEILAHSKFLNFFEN